MGFRKSKIQGSREVRKGIPAKPADIYRAFFEQEFALIWLRDIFRAFFIPIFSVARYLPEFRVSQLPVQHFYSPIQHDFKL
jgi:hypothetical protein